MSAHDAAQAIESMAREVADYFTDPSGDQVLAISISELVDICNTVGYGED